MASTFVYHRGTFARNLGESGMRRLATTLLVPSAKTMSPAGDRLLRSSRIRVVASSSSWPRF